ncbi:hypothetical protein VNI00_007411 [Paramarasmius palmivorus]|uniref:F-box domain-containing protein n=1 Tax=Paramarasmius palmivorus TaxID=297713 RepID=A0AAW0D3H9_9AGAR
MSCYGPAHDGEQQEKAEDQFNQSSRKTVFPIDRLPLEVLSRIFLHCTDIPVIVDGVGQRRGALYKEGWIALTHVCQHWRRLAMNTASLWTFPDFTHPILALEMLKRSKHAPLYIDFSSHTLTQRGWQAIDEAYKHIAHIAELRLSYPNATRMQDAVSNLVSPAPHLRELRFRCNYLYEGNGVIDLPGHFLGDLYPKFSHLSFLCCHVPWTAKFILNLDSLTCLSIVLGGKATYELPTRRQLFAILEKMPSLRKLELSEAVPPRHSEPPLPRSHINLPNLQVLNLTSTTIPDCLDFLTHVSFPRFTVVEIDHSDFEAQTRDEMATEIRLLEATMARLSLSTGVSDLFLGIEGIDPTELILKFSLPQPSSPLSTAECCDLGKCGKNPVAPRLYFKMKWKSETAYAVDEVIVAFLSMLSLRELKTLEVKFYDTGYLSTSTFRKFFASLKGLETIKITGHVLVDFIATLNHSIHTPSGSTHQQGSSFPSLHDLQLAHFDFRAQNELLSSLINACHYRKTYRWPVPTIHMEDCRLADVQTLLLEEHLLI